MYQQKEKVQKPSIYQKSKCAICHYFFLVALEIPVHHQYPNELTCHIKPNVPFPQLFQVELCCCFGISDTGWTEPEAAMVSSIMHVWAAYVCLGQETPPWWNWADYTWLSVPVVPMSTTWLDAHICLHLQRAVSWPSQPITGRDSQAVSWTRRPIRLETVLNFDQWEQRTAAECPGAQ